MAFKKWNVLATYNPTNSILDQILQNRGISDIPNFLSPPKALNLVSSFDSDFKKSLLDSKKLLLETIATGMPILIYGDYDADGVCAATIMYEFLKEELKYEKVFYFIPNRFEHGYGLSVKSIDQFLKEAGSPSEALFITVDTGITAVKESEYIKSLGHLLIITDHHQKPTLMPAADLIVWCDAVVGSTISWLVTKVLGSKDTSLESLAGLATVTDVQPLLNFNRSLVKESLEILNSTPPPAIKTLLDLSGRKDQEITVYDLGFDLGPRLNASGRIHSATESVKFLLEKDPAKASTYARNLMDINSKRQDKTLEMYDLAKGIDEKNLPKIIISESSEYHEGIIGLVASKLVQKFYRPAIVISLSEGYGKGSARSINGIDIIKLLRRFEHCFVNLGGHPMAAGFTISLDKITDFKKSIIDEVDRSFSDEVFVPSIDIDMKIPFDILDVRLIDSLGKMKPFGVGNREPIFMSENVSISVMNLVGKENSHVSFKFNYGNVIHKAIFFNAKEIFSQFSLGDTVDIVYNAKVGEFNGNRNVELTLSDIKLSQRKESKL